MEIRTDFYHLRPYETILHIKSFLAWDERVAKSYLKDMKKIAAKYYNDKIWAKLIDCRGWELHTPGSEELLVENAVNQFKTSLSHIALVAKQSEMQRWQIANIIPKLNIKNVKVFDTLPEAQDWLTELGYLMPPFG